MRKQKRPANRSVGRRDPALAADLLKGRLPLVDPGSEA